MVSMEDELYHNELDFEKIADDEYRFSVGTGFMEASGKITIADLYWARCMICEVLNNFPCKKCPRGDEDFYPPGLKEIETK